MTSRLTLNEWELEDGGRKHKIDLNGGALQRRLRSGYKKRDVKEEGEDVYKSAPRPRNINFDNLLYY